MSAKAKLIEYLAAGLEDTNGNPLSGYKVRTYASDGSTAKVVWEDRDKTQPTTNGKSAFTLDSTGRAVVYADGVYVIKVWTSTADPDVDNPYKTYPANSYKDDSAPIADEAFFGNVTAEVATLAALRAFDRNGVVDAVFMRSRVTQGDGGHGLYRWDSSNLASQVSADTASGIYVAPNSDSTGASGAWVRAHSGTYDIRWFGAVEGSDSYTSVLAAINFAKAAGGGVVRIPEGTWLVDSPLQISAANGVHIVGDGKGASIITRASNFSAASIRFHSGTNNSIRHLTLDCDGYDGRGIYLQDIRSFVSGVEVLDCPDRAIGLNGGGNAEYGLDSSGNNSDDAGFTSATFFPLGCKVLNCYAYNSGRTAISQKRMRYSEIAGNYVDKCYAEGVTDDKCDWSNIHDNVFVDVARTDGATAFPDKEAGSGYLTVGGGGVGGMGIDGSLYAKVRDNHFLGVQKDIATVNDRSKAAINFVNNIAASFGVVVNGNTIDDAKLGVRIMNGTGGDNFKHVVTENIFNATGTGAGTGSAEYGDVWIGTGQTGHSVTQNKHPNATLLLTDETGNNLLDSETTSFTPTLAFGGASVDMTYSIQKGRFQRWGRRITFEIQITLSAKGSSTGSAVVSGLPVAVDVNAVSLLNMRLENAATAPAQPYAAADAGASTISLYDDRSLTGTPTALNDTHFDNDTVLVITGSYEP